VKTAKLNGVNLKGFPGDALADGPPIDRIDELIPWA
jgi:hypothetical protein